MSWKKMEKKSTTALANIRHYFKPMNLNTKLISYQSMHLLTYSTFLQLAIIHELQLVGADTKEN